MMLVKLVKRWARSAQGVRFAFLLTGGEATSRLGGGGSAPAGMARREAKIAKARAKQQVLI